MNHIKRIALCIGNDEYSSLSVLHCAVADAKAISEELSKLKFVVIYKYNVPHFVYLNNINYEKDYDDNFEKEFYKMCTTIWPQFKEIEKLSNSNQPIEDPDNKGKYLNIKEHLSAPIIGIFSIVEQNDMLTTEEAPYGAMIIRNS